MYGRGLINRHTHTDGTDRIPSTAYMGEKNDIVLCNAKKSKEIETHGKRFHVCRTTSCV